jgi:hypothetical protein
LQQYIHSLSSMGLVNWLATIAYLAVGCWIALQMLKCDLANCVKEEGWLNAIWMTPLAVVLVIVGWAPIFAVDELIYKPLRKPASALLKRVHSLFTLRRERTSTLKA